MQMERSRTIQQRGLVRVVVATGGAFSFCVFFFSFFAFFASSSFLFLLFLTLFTGWDGIGQEAMVA